MFSDLYSKLRKINEDDTGLDYPDTIVNSIIHQFQSILANTEVDLKEEFGDNDGMKIYLSIEKQFDAIIAGGVADSDEMQNEYVNNAVSFLSEYIEETKKDLLDRFGDEETTRIMSLVADGLRINGA